MKKSILFGVLLLSSTYVLAVNPVALWMPVSLQPLMPQLMKAAEMAEATERCDKVMSGRHSSKRSTAERPVFSIVCRDAETKRTYSILYAVENGEVVEFNEQQRITGEKGETLSRPWENPALKPVENTGQTQPSAATASPTAAAPVSTVSSSLSQAPSTAAPTAAPEVPIDSRLAKLMARLEAAGVKGASAKVMMEDMQKKTLEDNLSQYDEAQARRAAIAKRNSTLAVTSSTPSVAIVTKSPAETAAELAKSLAEKSSASAPTVPAESTTAASAATAEKPAAPAAPAAEISNAIATQLWSQCLPAIKTKTASMIDRVLDEKTVPAGYSADAGATSMDVTFEAKNPEGQSLRFLAVCTVDAAGSANVKLRPRRE